MKRINAAVALAAVAFALVSSVSHAEVVKFNFTAHGTEVDYNQSGPAGFPATGAGAYLPVSATIAGSFFYDTSLHAVFPGSNTNGYYSTTGIGLSLSSSAGYHFTNNVTTEFGQPSVQVYDSNPDDQVVVSAAQTDSYGASHDVTLTLTGKNREVLTEAFMPTSLSSNDFNGALLIHWTDNVGKEFNYRADLDSLGLAPAATVPEPETYAMLLAGLALVGVAGRRKQRQAPKFVA